MRDSRHADEHRTCTQRILFDVKRMRRRTARMLSNFVRKDFHSACFLKTRSPGTYPPPAVTDHTCNPATARMATVYLSNHAASFSSNGSVYVSGDCPSPSVFNFLFSGDSSRSYVTVISIGKSLLVVQKTGDTNHPGTVRNSLQLAISSIGFRRMG